MTATKGIVIQQWRRQNQNCTSSPTRWCTHFYSFSCSNLSLSFPKQH